MNLSNLRISQILKFRTFAPEIFLFLMMQTNISYFVSFCVEQYKNAKQLTGKEAMEQLDKYGVLEYLAENYEILHTQNHHWILEDIDEFIQIRQQEAK